MNEMTSIIEESVNDLFAEEVTPESIETMESGGFPEPLWSTFDGGGWTRIALSEEDGGAGTGLSGGYTLMRIAGYHAAPLPVVEAILGTYLLSASGLPIPEGLLTVALADQSPPGENNGRLLLPRVPWARHARGVVVVLPGRNGSTGVAWVDRDSYQVQEHRNLAGEPRDDVLVSSRKPAEEKLIHATSTEQVRSWFALGRAAQIAGAAQKALERTIAYANERRQFGRPIGKFQAIQHQIAVQAEQLYAARCAADTAIAHLGTPQEWECIAAAKILSGEAVGIVAGTAHAVHGAIGFTKEFALQLDTRRLWSWREEYGNEDHWSRRLGEFCLALGEDRLWTFLTAQTG